MEWLLPLVLGALPFLLLLACPIAMLFLMRGHLSGQGMGSGHAQHASIAQEHLSALESEQARLAAEIAATRRELAASEPDRASGRTAEEATARS